MRTIPVLASIAVLLAALPALSQEDEAAAPDPEPAGARDHPAAKRFPGARMYAYQEREFEEVTIPAGKTLETVSGKFYAAKYWLPPKVSCTQVLKNFENAFRAKGMQVFAGTFEGLDTLRPADAAFNDTVEIEAADRYVTGVGAAPGGGRLYLVQQCHSDPDQPSGAFWAVEVEAMKQVVEVTADALAREMEQKGTVAVYGITFDTGKATITAGSARTLGEVAALLATRPDWKVRIEGHTDNVGKPKDNLDLSKRRATAVKEWLASKPGARPERLTTEGFGDTKPLADNASEDGRAKNRRVELVKLP